MRGRARTIFSKGFPSLHCQSIIKERFNLIIELTFVVELGIEAGLSWEGVMHTRIRPRRGESADTL